MGWLIRKRAAVKKSSSLLFLHSLLLAQCLYAKNSPAAFVPGALFSQRGTSLLPRGPEDLSRFCKSSCNMQGKHALFSKACYVPATRPEPSSRFVPRGQGGTWTSWRAEGAWGALGKGVGARRAGHQRSLPARRWAALGHQEGGSGRTPRASWRCWLNSFFCSSHNPRT